MAQLQRQLEKFGTPSRRGRGYLSRCGRPRLNWSDSMGSYPVAHPLRLDYTRVKDRLGGSPAVRRKATKPAFVELVALSCAQIEQYVIEFEFRGGSKRRIQ